MGTIFFIALLGLAATGAVLVARRTRPQPPPPPTNDPTIGVTWGGGPTAGF